MRRRSGQRARLKTMRPRLGTMPARLGSSSAQTYEQRRSSAAAGMYGRKWNREARRFKAENPLCLGCEAIGQITAADVTDHVVPHRGDRALFWNSSNWQSACRWHHDSIKERLEQMYERGEVGAEDLRLDSETARRLTLELMADQQK